MARQSELFGKDYQQLRPKKINELVGLLNAGNVDLGQGSAPRGISAKVQCLWDLIEDQAAGLVLKKQDSHASSSSSGEDDAGEGDLFLLTEQAYLHWQLGHRIEHTLVNTHSRDASGAKRAAPVPLCDRMVDQAYEDMVAGFMAKFLDMDRASFEGKVNVRRVDYETDYIKDSENFPGLSTIYAFYSVYFTLEMSLPLNFGRPILRTQKASNVEELWFWRPSHICPSPQRISSVDLSAYEMHRKCDAVQRAMEKALNLEDGTKSVLRVLKSSFDGGQPILLLVAVHRESLNTTQIMVVQAMWGTTDDEVNEQGRAGQELMQTLEISRRLAPGVGSLAQQVGGSNNYFWDDSHKFAVEAYQLPGSCLEQPEFAQAILSRNIQVPLLLLSELLAFAFGRGERTKTLQQLLPHLEGILARLVGPGSVLFQLMMQVSRGSVDIAEIYHLDTFGSITQCTDPRWNEHSVFHEHMGGLIESMCRMCKLPPPQHALREKLFEVQRLGQKLRSQYWRKEAWKPLCHVAHGNFSPSSVLLDAFGSSWLFNWGTGVTKLSWQSGKAKCGGLQPLFRDLARLSARFLMEGYPVPMSLRQAQLIVTTSWVQLEDISRWWDIPQSVAYLFQRKMFESELSSKADSRMTPAQASRRVSKLVESSSIPGNIGFDNLQGRLLGRDEDALEAFRSAEALVDELLGLPLLQLAACPRGEAGEATEADGNAADMVSRETALNHQKLLHRFGEESQRLCYERFLHEPKWMVDANHPEGNAGTQHLQLHPVDYSPLLFGLPLLEELLDLVVAPGLDPWQKAFGCSFATELCTRLLPVMGALCGKGPEVSLAEDQGNTGIDVRYAEGHRLPQRGDDEGLCFGACGKALDGTLQFRRGRLTPELLDKVLIGWPCPTSGVREAMVQQQRLGVEKLPPREDDLQKDPDLLETVRAARKANLWRKSAAGLYELAELHVRPRGEVERKGSIRSSPSAPARALSSRQAQKLLQRSLTPRDASSRVKTMEVSSLTTVDSQELQFLGRRIGLASSPSLMPKCRVAESHGECSFATVKETYGSFPCSLCKQIMTTDQPESPYFAYCERCWGRTSRRFSVCSKCLREKVTRCKRGQHQLQLLDSSPYVGIPSCSSCGKKITWPWQMELGDGESPLEPQWFHCSSCGSKKDLCLSCTPRYCPQRHKMDFLSPLKGGFTCKSCGKGAGADRGGGLLQLYHCRLCQEAKCEVVYPNGEAALADVKLTMSMNEVKVSSVVAHGPASLAGVLPGQRVLVNDQPLVSPTALEEMMDTILVEFLSATCFDASFESAKAVRENLAFQLHDGRLFITEVKKFHARSLGVDLGCQLLSVNGMQAVRLVGGGSELALESLKPPYLLRLRQSGPKLLCHQGCGATCDRGHAMKAQYCGGVLCPKGHTLKCVAVPPLADYIRGGSEAATSCESCKESLAEDQLALACEECMQDYVRLPSSADRFNLLCFHCGWRQSVKALSDREESPYKGQGQVQCQDCGRNIMEQGAGSAGSAGAHPDARRFHHCASCWEDGIKDDRCYFCSIRHLACPKAHSMVPCLQSPFQEDLECLECHDELMPREAGYHCGDCWWHGKRNSRCESCGSLKLLKYCIDHRARLQVVTGDASKADVTWASAFQPIGHSVLWHENTEFEVDIAMKLRGLIYPLGTRMALSSANFCEATVISLHETGKYILRLDGTRKQLLFEPHLANHVAAGVWRYGAGQRLLVFVEGKWRELRVHKVSTYGNQHVLEELGKQCVRWEIDLNSFNHSPAWLSMGDWWLELRRWEDMLLCSLSARDVFTAQPVDILTLSWPLADGKNMTQDVASRGVFALVPEVDASLWPQLLSITSSRSPNRHRGASTAREVVLLLGPVGCGKSQLLRRLAMEALVAHDGEMVPLLVTAMQLFLGTCTGARASNETLQQRRMMRRSAQDSQELGTTRFLSADFLVIYIRLAYGADTATTRFLRQAFHMRRLLLLVDDLQGIPVKMQTVLLQGLSRLCGIGIRVVVAGSPPPEVFEIFEADKSEEDEEVPAELSIQKPSFRMTMASSEMDGVAPKKSPSASPASPASRKTLASSNSSLEMEKESSKSRARKVEIRQEQDCWWLPQEQAVRRLWLCPPRPAERQLRAKLRLGPITPSPQEVLEEAQESKLFESFLSVQSAPFLELMLSYTEMSILHPDAEVLTPAPIRNSLRSSSLRSSRADSMLSTARVSLPFLVEPKKEVEQGPIWRGACSILDELFTATCMQTVRSLQEMKMEHGGRKPPEMEGGHLKLTLRLLALKATENGSDRVDAEEANDAIEFGGSSQLMYLWRELQPVMKNGDFWLLRRCECWNYWDELVVYYIFPCPCVQSFFASLELTETWNKQFSLASVDDAFKERQWHSLLPFLAEMLPGPMTLRFSSITEDKARLMVEFFGRHPMVTHLDVSGCALGMHRTTLRFVAQALERDQNLQHLDMSDNCLGSEGVHSLCHALMGHPSLEELVLDRNHIGQVGGVKIVDLLRVNHHILRVELDENPVGAEWAHYIYVLQRDRSATLASARRFPPLGSKDSKGDRKGKEKDSKEKDRESSKESKEKGDKGGSVPQEGELLSEMKELKPALPLSSRLRRKEEDVGPVALTARTPRLLR